MSVAGATAAAAAPAAPAAPAAAGAHRSARALVIGPGARRALGAPAGAVATAGGTVEWAFGPGGYVRFGERYVLLAPARSPMGPLSILVSGLTRGDLLAGAPAAVSGDALLVGALRISLAGAREAPLPRAVALAPGWRAALEVALAVVGPAPDELAPGLAALAHGDVARAAAQLAGRGDGLTPAGDDVLAGYAAWRWSCGRRVAPPAARCAPLGREYLRCAERGELPSPAADVLSAIRRGDRPAALRRARGLREWGASSGAALLWGIAAGATGDADAGDAGAGDAGGEDAGAGAARSRTREGPARLGVPGLR